MRTKNRRPCVWHPSVCVKSGRHSGACETLPADAQLKHGVLRKVVVEYSCACGCKFDAEEDAQEHGVLREFVQDLFGISSSDCGGEECCENTHLDACAYAGALAAGKVLERVCQEAGQALRTCRALRKKREKRQAREKAALTNTLIRGGLKALGEKSMLADLVKDDAKRYAASQARK